MIATSPPVVGGSNRPLGSLGFPPPPDGPPAPPARFSKYFLKNVDPISSIGSTADLAATVQSHEVSIRELRALVSQLQMQVRELQLGTPPQAPFDPDALWTDDFSGGPFHGESSGQTQEHDADDHHHAVGMPPPPAPRRRKKGGGGEQPQITHLMKRLVWAKHVGAERGETPCLCCRLARISQLSFHCGHVVSSHRGGATTVDNLRPICQSCNSSMGTRDMREYMQAHGLGDDV